MTTVLVVVLSLAAFQSLALVFLALTYRDDRDHWREKESELLNRIKPETAQPLAHAPVEEWPVPIPTDDDEAWHEAVQVVSDGRAA